MGGKMSSPITNPANPISPMSPMNPINPLHDEWKEGMQHIGESLPDPEFGRHEGTVQATGLIIIGLFVCMLIACFVSPSAK